MSAAITSSLNYAVLVESPENARLDFMMQSAVDIIDMPTSPSSAPLCPDSADWLLVEGSDSIPWDSIAAFLSRNVRVARSGPAPAAVVLVWGCGLCLESPSLLSASSHEALRHISPRAPLPLALVLFAMHGRGVRDAGSRAYLQHLIDRVDSDEAASPQSPGILDPAAADFRSAFLRFVSFPPLDSDLLIKGLCSEGAVFDNAWQCVQDAAACFHQLGNCKALSCAMALLIPVLGHASGQNDDSRRRLLRDQAMRSLHCIIDGHDWQGARPFEQCWVKTLGCPCSVSVSLPLQCAGKSFAFVLYSPLGGPSLDSGSPCDPALLESVARDNSSIYAGRPRAALLAASVSQLASKQGPATVEASFHLPCLSHCGFYDWKLVSISEDGKLTAEVFDGAAVCGRVIVVADVNASAIVSLCPEFLSQSAQTKRPSDRYSSSDSIDLQAPPGRRDSFGTRDPVRGSFSVAAQVLPELKQQGCNGVYVVDALQRNHGAPPAFDLHPPPQMMQVTDRAKFSTALGGDGEFANLVSRAHEIGMKVFIDGAVRVSSSKAASKYEQLLLKTISAEHDYLVPHTHSDSRSVLWQKTTLLNYRRFSAWTLTLSDLLAAISASGCDGCVLDSGINWPIMLPQDLRELSCVSSDGQSFYTADDLFFGSVVTADAAMSLYAQTVEACYPSPFLAWLTRCIWFHFPNFCFISDTLAVKSAESKLMNCGVIPCSKGLSGEVLKVLGRHVIPGNVTSVATSAMSADCEHLDSYFDGMKMFHKASAVPRMPIGSPIFKISSSLYQPTPAVLFKRHNWSWVDILTFTPGVSTLHPLTPLCISPCVQVL